MRILAVVSIVSPDGAYGGPTRVALNQAQALTDRGHEVVVAAGTRGYVEPPDRANGVPLRLFPVVTTVPGAGFAGLSSPGLARWLIRVLREVDVVHVHLARDLLTLPSAAAALMLHVPYVVQTHGMIDPSERFTAHLLDAVATRRVLRGASSVLYLTDGESADLRVVNRGPLPLVQVPNGVPEPAVTLAPTDPPEVLFLARLAARKRPMLFVEMARQLTRSFPDARFTLVGPDEGEGPAVEAAIQRTGAARWEGPVAPDRSLERMAKSSIYVLPAVDEPFGMTVAEAMSLGLPVVVTDSCGLAPLVAEHDCGIVVASDSLDELSDAVRALLGDRQRCARLGSNGRRVTRELMTMDAIAEKLERLYRRPRIASE